MPWKVNFIQDTEAEGVGTLMAFYSDDVTRISFAHSRRVDTNNATHTDAFKAEAREVLAKHAKYASDNATVADVIAADLNK